MDVSKETENDPAPTRRKLSKSKKAKLATKRLIKLRSKNYPAYKIPQSKLKRALDFLEGEPELHPAGSDSKYSMCFGNIANQVSASRCVNNFMTDSYNVMSVACQCAERGQWADFMKTVQILCEDPRFYDVHAALRNALFGIIADPSFSDRSLLESYLYANPRCRNPGDVEYCISKILEVFQGIMIRPKLRRSEKKAELPKKEESDDD